MQRAYAPRLRHRNRLRRARALECSNWDHYVRLRHTYRPIVGALISCDGAQIWSLQVIQDMFREFLFYGVIVSNYEWPCKEEGESEQLGLGRFSNSDMFC